MPRKSGLSKRTQNAKALAARRCKTQTNTVPDPQPWPSWHDNEAILDPILNSHPEPTLQNIPEPSGNDDGGDLRSVAVSGRKRRLQQMREYSKNRRHGEDEDTRQERLLKKKPVKAEEKRARRSFRKRRETSEEATIVPQENRRRRSFRKRRETW